MKRSTALEFVPIILAYGNGADIQIRQGFSDKWEDSDEPNFLEDIEYRIKPKEDFQKINELIASKELKTKKSQEAIYCSDINSQCDTILLNNKLKQGFKVIMKDRIDGRRNGITGYRYILEKEINKE